MAPKIICPRRKEKSCKAAPEVCRWDDATQQCFYLENIDVVVPKKGKAVRQPKSKPRALVPIPHGKNMPEFLGDLLISLDSISNSTYFAFSVNNVKVYYHYNVNVPDEFYEYKPPSDLNGRKHIFYIDKTPDIKKRFEALWNASGLPSQMDLLSFEFDHEHFEFANIPSKSVKKTMDVITQEYRKVAKDNCEKLLEETISWNWAPKQTVDITDIFFFYDLYYHKAKQAFLILRRGERDCCIFDKDIYNELYIEKGDEDFKYIHDAAQQLFDRVFVMPLHIFGDADLLADLQIEPVRIPPYENILHKKDGQVYYPKRSVRHDYVNVVGSTELNVSLIYLLTEREKIASSLLTRMRHIMKEFSLALTTLERYQNDIVVYHGTSQMIHAGKEFVTIAFLSTTRHINVAYKYAMPDPFIYIIKLGGGYPFINFRDDLKQILLPPGATIRVNEIRKVMNQTWIYCEAAPYEQEVFDALNSVILKPCFKKYNLSMLKNKKQSAIEFRPIVASPNLVPLTFDRSSSVFYTYYESDTEYIVKYIVKQSNKIGVLYNPNQIFKRVLNEVLASQVYKRVYDCQSLDLKIMVLKEGSDYTPYIISRRLEGIQYNTNDSNADIFMTDFLVDCIMGNWDTFKRNNIGYLTEKSEPIHTDVGGAMGYRGKGDENLQFRINIEPVDHLTISRQLEFKELQKLVSPNVRRQILKKIQIDNFIERVQQVKADFVGYLKQIKDEETQKHYINFLSNLMDALVYRHNYYLMNAKRILSDLGMHVSSSPQQGGSGINILHEEKVKEDVLEANNGNQDFTMSPKQFKEMLKKLSVCRKN